MFSLYLLTSGDVSTLLLTSEDVSTLLLTSEDVFTLLLTSGDVSTLLLTFGDVCRCFHSIHVLLFHSTLLFHFILHVLFCSTLEILLSFYYLMLKMFPCYVHNYFSQYSVTVTVMFVFVVLQSCIPVCIHVLLLTPLLI